jgi:hypothetical protein
VTNKHASEQGDGARVGNAHCVKAAPGKYMCSHQVTANGVMTCHLMQVQWRPERPSAITVMLALLREEPATRDFARFPRDGRSHARVLLGM